MAFQKLTMDQWITDVVNDTGKDGIITAIQCVHKEGSREQEVFSVRQLDGKIDAISIANVFQRKAETHVQGIAGYQQFFLYAFYGARQEWQARFPFRIENASDISYGTSEPPTEEGRRQQGMRHHEAGFQFFFQQSVSLASIQNALIKDLAKDRTELMREGMDAVNAIKEISLAMANRQFELEMLRSKHEREAKLIDGAVKVGPTLLNALVGKEVIPTNTADSMLLEGLMENLTAETMQKIQELNIPQELKAAFSARATEYWKKKIEAEKAAIEATKGRTIDPILEEAKAAE